MTRMNRAELERELAELEAANAAVGNWGAAVSARSERITEIRRALERRPGRRARPLDASSARRSLRSPYVE